jgi:DNA-directed RNA polymerase subunit N (RpoN/RPB10)
MLIPVRCFTCGTVIANKYEYYCTEVRKRKLEKGMMDKVTYLTPTFRKKGIEGDVLDELKITNTCCRTRFLTHVDIV